MRRQAEQRARLEREKAVREETRRLERAIEEARRKKKRAKELMREEKTRELYETRWKELLSPSSVDTSEGNLLSFEDVPWPIVSVSTHGDTATRGTALAGEFTVETIGAFLFPPDSHDEGADLTKTRKDKLRETMLRYHPDKFEGRVMQRVRPSERDVVKEAVGIVARTLNALMAQYR